MIAKLSWPLIAAGITIGLFLLMGYLITPKGEIPAVDDTETHIRLTRVDRDETSATKGRKKPVKPAPVKKPPPQEIAKTKPVILKDDDGLAGDFPEIDGETDFGLEKMDRRATPVVRIPPQYPQGPLNRNVEGWVLIEFTITKTGTVENAHVIEAEPAKTFNRAALRAIKRWKYQPQMLNGKSVAQDGMREIFRFEIDKK